LCYGLALGKGQIAIKKIQFHVKTYMVFAKFLISELVALPTLCALFP
jgi:hypothetical protein